MTIEGHKMMAHEASPRRGTQPREDELNKVEGPHPQVQVQCSAAPYTKIAIKLRHKEYDNNRLSMTQQRHSRFDNKRRQDNY